jgi:hypothetical protein
MVQGKILHRGVIPSSYYDALPGLLLPSRLDSTPPSCDDCKLECSLPCPADLVTNRYGGGDGAGFHQPHGHDQLGTGTAVPAHTAPSRKGVKIINRIHAGFRSSRPPLHFGWCGAVLVAVAQSFHELFRVLAQRSLHRAPRFNPAHLVSTNTPSIDKIRETTRK